MKKAILAIVAAAAVAGCMLFGDGDLVSVKSPDGRCEIRLRTNPLAFAVLHDGKQVVAETPISIDIDGRRLAGGDSPAVVRSRSSGEVSTPVYKKGKVRLDANAASVDFGSWGVDLVARDDGVAYRFKTMFDGTVRVNGECAGFTIPDPAAACDAHFAVAPGREETFCRALPARDLKTGGDEKSAIIYPPALYRTAGTTVAVLESDVCDYPTCNYTAAGESAGKVPVKGWFEGWPKAVRRIASFGGKSNPVASGGRKIIIDEHEDWLVETEGKRTFPWRVFALASNPSDLFASDIVFALAKPATPGDDFSWVKPGKVAWDWWNAFDNKGDPEGCTTETYIRFIDFAAANGIEYVIMDEGWSAKLDIWKFSPVVDVPRVIDYANEKGVGIILWMAWAQVVGDEEHVAEHFAKLGAKGFKVDFIDRGDAQAERFIWKFAEVCRKQKMLVDYHGVHHPAGLCRTYPNVLNYEGVGGLEKMKWNDNNSAILKNDVDICFTRMTAGPMDYTPGAMDNYPVGKYPGLGPKRGTRPLVAVEPGSIGTRSRQMAMIALYEAPLQMLCDSPTKYEKNMECLRFLSAIPTVWDDTVGLGGEPRQFAAVARRKGGVWYASGITNADSRDFDIDTSFLGAGEWKMDIFRDTADGDTAPSKYDRVVEMVRSGAKVRVHMAKGGGFVARFSK